MTYSYKPGARIKAPAQVAGEMCDELKRTGGLTAKRLVDANREEDAPLHDEFEWDDGVAAEAYREDQARYIIRCVVTEVEVPGAEQNEPIITKAFVHVTEKTGEYIPINVVVRTPEYMDVLLEKARAELNAFAKKYAVLTELQGVIDTIVEYLEVEGA